MESLPYFLVSIVVISLTGVMFPGPVTAVTVAAGTRKKHAGALVALGHGIVEFPLMGLIMFGAGRFFQMAAVQGTIAVMGGLVLMYMAWQVFSRFSSPETVSNKMHYRNPIWIGIVLTAGNPYFLLWWATIGLALATQAGEYGVFAFGIFAVVHWLCDFFWLEALSWAGYKSATLFKESQLRIVLKIMAVVLLFFALSFIYDGISRFRFGG